MAAVSKRATQRCSEDSRSAPLRLPAAVASLHSPSSCPSFASVWMYLHARRDRCHLEIGFAMCRRRRREWRRLSCRRRTRSVCCSCSASVCTCDGRAVLELCVAAYSSVRGVAASEWSRFAWQWGAMDWLAGCRLADRLDRLESRRRTEKIEGAADSNRIQQVQMQPQQQRRQQQQQLQQHVRSLTGTSTTDRAPDRDSDSAISSTKINARQLELAVGQLLRA